MLQINFIRVHTLKTLDEVVEWQVIVWREVGDKLVVFAGRRAHVVGHTPAKWCLEGYRTSSIVFLFPLLAVILSTDNIHANQDGDLVWTDRQKLDGTIFFSPS